MESGKKYSVHELAKMSGISVRTLHYYDELGLLPARRKSNNYRYYDSTEVDRLHQILLYREFGMELDAIREILDEPNFNAVQALVEHRSKLVAQQKRLDMLIAGVDKTLSHIQEGVDMTDSEKFEGFKKELIEENERLYGAEIREKYGDEEIDASNAKLMGLSQEQFARSQAIEKEMRVLLEKAMDEGDPAGASAQEACDLHRQWLSFYWKEGMYSKQAHLGLGEMYVADDRFKAYYDEQRAGTAEFLRDALAIYCSK